MTFSMYQSASEIDGMVAGALPITGAQKAQWDALDESDKDKCSVWATLDIDAVHWRGEPLSDVQELAFPRCEHGERVGTADPNPPAAPLVGDLPKELRIAHALQAIHRMSSLAGADLTQHVLEGANRGVTSHGGANQSESIDLARANRAWARLSIHAQTAMRKLRFAGGVMV